MSPIAVGNLEPKSATESAARPPSSATSVTTSKPIASPGTDWTLRLLDRIPGPLWIPFAVSVATFVFVAILYRAVAGDPADLPLNFSLFRQYYFWLDLLIGVIAAYLWVANGLLHRGLLRDLTALRESIVLTDDAFDEVVRGIAGPPASWLFIAALCGVAAMTSMAVFDPGFWTFDRPNFFSFEMAFYLGRQIVVGWIAGHVMMHEFVATRGLARLGGSHVRIDLLDLRPLKPFAHKGLRSAATWLVCSSLVSLFWLSEGVALTVGPIVLTVLVMSLAVFLRPLVPLHSVITARKQDRLNDLRDAIRAEQDPLRTSDASASPRYANLVASYNLVQNAREWPLEASTVLRFAAFAVLGLGSWLGGALVERLLEFLVR